jgi:hypothetical protein
VERGRKEPSSEVLAAICGSLRIELADVLAEVGHELTADRAPVFRLETALPPRQAASPVPVRRPGDIMLLAA